MLGEEEVKLKCSRGLYDTTLGVQSSATRDRNVFFVFCMACLETVFCMACLSSSRRFAGLQDSS